MSTASSRFCQQCGAQVSSDAKFCHSCGEQLSDFELRDGAPEVGHVTDGPRPTFDLASPPAFRWLRALNWILAGILIPSSFLIALRSNELYGVALFATIAGLVAGTYLVTAIALSQSIAVFGSVVISGTRPLLRKLAFVGNLILVAFGLFAAADSFVDHQFWASLPMLIYAVPSALNIRGLWILRRYTR